MYLYVGVLRNIKKPYNFSVLFTLEYFKPKC